MPNRSAQTAPPPRLYAEWVAVALVATALVVALVLGRLTERLDHIIYDNALTASGRPPPDDIVIIAIDNRAGPLALATQPSRGCTRSAGRRESARGWL